MELFEIMNEYYHTHDENARLVSRHGSVEFLTTVRYVGKYMKPGMRLLEIGAGTGRYSHYFARKGISVTAVELVPHNVEQLRAATEPDETLDVYEGNALDLSFLSTDSFDMTLLLGPMYHLFDETDKLTALREAVRVTKPGGLLYTAYCMNEATVLQFGFMRGNLLPYMEAGMLDPVTFKCASVPSEVFELYRREQIDALIRQVPVTRLHYVGTDMMTRYIREEVDAMDDALFAQYLNYHYLICERPDMVGVSNHVLDICRKNKN